MSEQGSAATVAQGFSPLDVVTETFQVLAREPAPLKLFSTDLGREPPRPRLRLDEVQALLLDPR